VRDALRALTDAAEGGKNLLPPSIVCAKARVTTGEWADALRAVFGEYRAATGVEGAQLGLRGEKIDAIRRRVDAWAATQRMRPRILVGKAGLDGHSNGAEMIAVAARDAGFEVIYGGIRLTPEEIVRTAVDEDTAVIGLSILSGSHVEIARQVLEQLARHGVRDTMPVVVGGIIPDHDVAALRDLGVKAVFTPKDYDLVDVMDRVLDVIGAPRVNGSAASATAG
jgi:(2R)-ethylmalonyl-CoA mutase